MPPALDRITDFPALVDYLRDELEWPIPEGIGLEEATYDVTPEEIGLKSEAIGGGIEIKQLRPLNRAQPWGVFFLNLPSARLPVTLVRNILGKLAIKKRASANRSEQAAFAQHDLLFIAATGAASERRLAFAHFSDDQGATSGSGAATLKVLGWDADDTPRRLGLTEASLKTRLHWPDDVGDADHWRRQWGEAFAHADTRTVVRDSRAMAKALAALARRIRERAKELIAAQTANGSLVRLHAAFREALIHDLTPEGFADTYAQTIAYGLLSTAISSASGGLTQDDMAGSVAGTSPFLKEMLGAFIEAGGRNAGAAPGLDFDELGISEVVELLRHADMAAVLADFDRRNPDEDPVIHFYELFLKEYDAAQKVKRGVFYTPRPVVGFIVRSVDEALRTGFGLEDGLASTATWGEVIGNGVGIELPAGASESDPFVRILDPATGTGTFLVECVDLIHRTMTDKWKAAGKRDAEIKALWNAYVPEHLLPRLTGFELMMAPYAIAHVKLGLKLADTGYAFGSDARAQIYLTNALEPAQDLDMQLAFMSEALAHEAKAANAAKETRFTVVVGNPPYAGHSSNPIKDASGRRTFAGELISRYFVFDGLPLKEKQPKWLHDDYVKFLGLSEHALRKSGQGVIGMVTNHGYIDNPTFRGLRQQLMETFGELAIVDLAGSIRKRGIGAGVDENVFDIEQGTAVIVGKLGNSPAETVRFSRLEGVRTAKYAELNAGTMARIASGERFAPARPFLAFDSAGPVGLGEYAGYQALPELFPVNSGGIVSGRDEFALDFDRTALLDRIRVFADPALSNEEVRARFSIVDAGGYVLANRRPSVYLKPPEEHIGMLHYRPFDYRFAFLSRAALTADQTATHRHLLSGDNVGLVSTRQTRDGWDAKATRHPIGHKALAAYDFNSLFPLWLEPQGTETRRLPNIAPAFAARVAALTGLAYDEGLDGPGQPGRSFGPRDLFDYVYAVLHAPAYRARYAEYLKSAFARVPLPGGRALFEALVPLGAELVALHLLDADALPILRDPKGIRLAGSGEARVVDKPVFDPRLGRVAINATRWFETVPKAVWECHVGGYQPAQKWLKDRAAKTGKRGSPGCVLSEADVLHYRRMILALGRTLELLPGIDAAIDAEGGWPDAFRGMAG